MYSLAFYNLGIRIIIQKCRLNRNFFYQYLRNSTNQCNLTQVLSSERLMSTRKNFKILQVFCCSECRWRDFSINVIFLQVLTVYNTSLFAIQQKQSNPRPNVKLKKDSTFPIRDLTTPASDSLVLHYYTFIKPFFINYLCCKVLPYL